MSQIQTQQELDDFYKNPDPWAYKSNPDDIRRRHELLACLPNNKYQRVLDIGCGNGFLTSQLPGSEVIGVDLSASAVDWAKESVSEVADSSRFKFQQASIFELKSEKLGKFDLIIITGLLYKQYIGKSNSLIFEIIDDLLSAGGVLATCHIHNWNPPKFPYALIDINLYQYRDYFHRLEIYKK